MGYLPEYMKEYYVKCEKHLDYLVNETYRRKEKGPIDKPIVHGFVQSFEINAFACSYKDVDLIAVNVGLVDYLMILSNVLMSHKNILPWVGDTTHEEEFQFDIRRGMNDPLWLFQNGWGRVPKCQSRQRYARLLFGIALEFVLLHELAHVTRGHVDWIQQRGCRQIQERQPVLSASSLDWQALELDADCTAAYEMASLAFQPTWARRVQDAVGNDVPTHAASHLFSFGTQLFFLSIAEGDDWRRDLNGSHPPVAFRRSFLLPTASQHYSMHQPHFLEDFEKSAIQAVVEADLAFSILRGESLNWTMIGTPGDWLPDWWYHGQQHGERLSAHFKSMKPQLEPLIRRGRLPVA